jgi:hypothetical protein
MENLESVMWIFVGAGVILVSTTDQTIHQTLLAHALSLPKILSFLLTRVYVQLPRTCFHKRRLVSLSTWVNNY